MLLEFELVNNVMVYVYISFLNLYKFVIFKCVYIGFR